MELTTSEFEKKITKRDCPFCGSSQSRLKLTLKPDQFVDVNPTHNLEWFDELNIPCNYHFPFFECDDCTMVYSGVQLRNDVNFEFYNKGIRADLSKAKIYKASKRLHKTKLWNALIQHFDFNLLDKSEELMVLDYGAGWGDFLAIASGMGTMCVGLEYDERKIEHALKYGIQCGDYEFIDERAPYHIFMCDQVLEHLPDPGEALSKLQNLLIKGAVGFIGVPNFHKSRIDDVASKANRGEKVDKTVNPFGHLNYFSPALLAEMVEKHGFEVLEMNYDQRVQSWAERVISKLGFIQSKKRILNRTSLFVRKR